MDCIGSPTAKTVRPSPGVHPAVSAVSSCHWLREVSWNSSTRTCDRCSSRARSRSVGADSSPSARTAPAAISAWSTSPRSAKTRRSCAAATGSTETTAASASHCADAERGGRHDEEVGERLAQARGRTQFLDERAEFLLGCLAATVLFRREPGVACHRLAPFALRREQEPGDSQPRDAGALVGRRQRGDSGAIEHRRCPAAGGAVRPWRRR